MNWLKKMWHALFGRKHRLAVRIDRGKGCPVILLPGLASDYRAWRHVHQHISKNCRVVALDLLGFGKSPRPNDIEYTVEDHAEAVITTLKRLGIKRGAVLAGHSMGALVTVEVARRQPSLAKQLICYGMPVYRFDARRRLLPNQDTMFLRMFQQMLKEKTAIGVIRNIKRMRSDLESIELTKDNFHAFQGSLQHTIMGQRTFEHLGQLAIPVRIISGRLDTFLVRRHCRMLAKQHPNISVITLNEPHVITPKAAVWIIKAINAAAEK